MTNSSYKNSRGREYPWGPGIVQVRHIASKVYGIRVRRSLAAKLVDVPGLDRANPTSDLFCIHVDAMDDSPESALDRFRAAVVRAGLGAHFGLG